MIPRHFYALKMSESDTSGLSRLLKDSPIFSPLGVKQTQLKMRADGMSPAARATIWAPNEWPTSTNFILRPK